MIKSAEPGKKEERLTENYITICKDTINSSRLDHDQDPGAIPLP